MNNSYFTLYNYEFYHTQIFQLQIISGFYESLTAEWLNEVSGQSNWYQTVLFSGVYSHAKLIVETGQLASKPEPMVYKNPFSKGSRSWILIMQKKVDTKFNN